MPGNDRALAARPIYTEIHDAASFTVPTDAVYLSGRGGEERDEHVVALTGRCTSCEYVAVNETEPLVAELSSPSINGQIRLRSTAELNQVWQTFAGRKIYLDVTGLPHRVWAPMLRSGLAADSDLSVVYVEPLKYRFNAIRTEGELFDLSVQFDGPGSLPGFVSLAEPAEDEVLLVPLLGFEGQRFSMVLDTVQPDRENVIPVVGVPGFQPEFVYYAYHGNRLPLEETRSWQSIRFATANCPFSLFYLLEDLAHIYPDAFMKIAPIGTKPHGVGAVLFALSEPDRVELIYDFPVKRPARTEGAARLLVYHVAAVRDRLRAFESDAEA